MSLSQASSAVAQTASAHGSGQPDSANAGWHASLELDFQHVAPDRTVLLRREHRGPLRVQKALYPEGPRICHAVIVHPPGGIAGGDQLRLAITVGDAAHCLITTPGATKWYRTPQAASAQHVELRLANNAVLEWLPQESIIFNHADASSSMNIELGQDSLFLGWETLCFGRTAAGETFSDGQYRQRWRIRQGADLLWNESGVLAGGSRLLLSPVGLNGEPVCATLIAAGRAIPVALLGAARTALLPLPFAHRVAITRLPKLLVARYAGPSSEEARSAFIALWSMLRPQLAGVAAQLPRLWAT